MIKSLSAFLRFVYNFFEKEKVPEHNQTHNY
jgi:hypothetical protein